LHTTVYIRNLSHITPKTEIDALLYQDKIRLYHLHTEGWEAIVQDNLLEAEGYLVRSVRHYVEYMSRCNTKLIKEQGIMDNKKKQQKETEDNGLYTLLGCAFCHGTGMSTFVDMSKVPDYTSMVMGDETWKKYEELGNCPEGCEVLN